MNSKFSPAPVLLQRSYLVSPLGLAHLSCSNYFSDPLAMAGLLWVRPRSGTSLLPLAQGREVWKARRGGRSTSSATPPLPKEPVGPNFAFALE